MGGIAIIGYLLAKDTQNHLTNKLERKMHNVGVGNIGDGGGAGGGGRGRCLDLEYETAGCGGLRSYYPNGPAIP